MMLANILAAAKRAQAAYIEDISMSQAAFESLGLVWLGMYRTSSCQAVVSRKGVSGATYLSISGTRFSTGKLMDLLDDLDLDPVDLGGGVKVTEGAYDDCAALWSWAKGLAGDVVWNVEGHSLGAWRTRYTPLFVEDGKVGDLHSFESPKGANDLYWVKYAKQLSNLVSVVNGRDLFVSWPFTGPWRHPAYDLLWLHETGFEIITPDQWTGGVRESDHSIDLVVARLQSIVDGGK